MWLASSGEEPKAPSSRSSPIASSSVSRSHPALAGFSLLGSPLRAHPCALRSAPQQALRLRCNKWTSHRIRSRPGYTKDLVLPGTLHESVTVAHSAGRKVPAAISRAAAAPMQTAVQATDLHEVLHGISQRALDLSDVQSDSGTGADCSRRFKFVWCLMMRTVSITTTSFNCRTS